MKSNKVVKFTLTAICMAVLSACGSDGDSKPAISSTNTTTQQQQAAAKAAAEKAAAEKAAAEKAAAEKAAAEKAAAEKAAAEKAAAEKAAAEKAAAAKAAAEKAAAEKAAAEEAAKNAANTEGLDDAQLVSGQITVDEKAKSHVGAKHVTKNGSDFILNNAGNFANNPTAMNVQLHPALDTVVVAEPTLDKDGKPVKDGKYGYLEDFDFRGTEVKDGVLTLNDIYDGKSTLGGKKDRNRSVTKTDSRGTGTGTVYVVKDGLKNYAERDVAGSVAEVYGHLTRPDTANGFDNKGPYTTYEDSANQNLPLAGITYEVNKNDEAVVKKTTNANVLKNVQYGRVTTQLNQAKLENFKEGLSMGKDLETLVVGYGKFGETGTENHYFYRGVNATTADQIAALKGNTFTYNGHAVSYGLDDNAYATGAGTKLPNALGYIYDAKLVSGNHVTAKVNFDTMKVTDGSIYNVWNVNENGKVSDKLSNLVTFGGTLHKNGAITGTAANENRKGAEAAGVFAATLYGEKAQEMGGVISSNVKDAGKAWGAVFGANTVIPKAPTKPEAPKPTNPFTEATNKK